MADEEPEDLVYRIMSGDRSAEIDLVKRYSNGLITMLRFYVRDEDTAWDVHQETFCTVIQRLRGRGIDAPAKISAFLRGTARTLAKNHFSSRARHPTDPNWAFIQQVADDNPGPCDRLSQDELTTFAHRILDELNVPRDRDILRRFYLYNENRATICQALDITYEHFDRVMSRARSRVRALAGRRHEEILGAGATPDNAVAPTRHPDGAMGKDPPERRAHMSSHADECEK